MHTMPSLSAKTRGFTLIELMITVAIIGIIAAIAFPSYIQSVRKSHRADAQTRLTSIGQALERCYTQNFSYINCPYVTGASGVTQAPTPGTTPAGFYTLTATATANTYTVTATAIGGQAKDTSCTPITLDNTGNKLPVSCWSN